MKTTTTIGIVCDNYKLKKYKRKLKLKGLTDFKVSDFTNDTSTIKVTTDSSNVGLIKKLCEDLERHFTAIKN